MQCISKNQIYVKQLEVYLYCTPEFIIIWLSCGQNSVENKIEEVHRVRALIGKYIGNQLNIPGV